MQPWAHLAQPTGQQARRLFLQAHLHFVFAGAWAGAGAPGRAGAVSPGAKRCAKQVTQRDTGAGWRRGLILLYLKTSMVGVFTDLGELKTYLKHFPSIKLILIIGGARMAMGYGESTRGGFNVGALSLRLMGDIIWLTVSFMCLYQ